METNEVTQSSTPKYSIITVSNYDKFQEPTQCQHSDQHTTNTVINTTSNTVNNTQSNTVNNSSNSLDGEWTEFNKSLANTVNNTVNNTQSNTVGIEKSTQYSTTTKEVKEVNYNLNLNNKEIDFSVDKLEDFKELIKDLPYIEQLQATTKWMSLKHGWGNRYK